MSYKKVHTGKSPIFTKALDMFFPVDTLEVQGFMSNYKKDLKQALRKPKANKTTFFI